MGQAVVGEHGLHADAGAVILGPELTLGAGDGCADAAADILIPDSSAGTHGWAALAGAGVVVPDHHVAAVLGHAEALAAGVVPEVVGLTGYLRDADPVTVFGGPVGVDAVKRRFRCGVTFAGARFGIVILN